MSVFVVGCGSVGSALAAELAVRGTPVIGGHCRTERSAQEARQATGLNVTFGPLPSELKSAQTVILAVPDPELPGVAAALREFELLGAGQVALHCAGALPASVLSPLTELGVAIGAFHPLLSFADHGVARSLLRGAAFAIDGDPAARQRATELAESLGGQPFVVTGADRPLYHAAAAIASNHLVALVAHAVRCLEPVGLDTTAALSALSPLLHSTLANLDMVGLPRALTGPVSRGDSETVEGHVRALSSRSAEEEETYRVMAMACLSVARDQGRLSDLEVERIEAALNSKPLDTEMSIK